MLRGIVLTFPGILGPQPQLTRCAGRSSRGWQRLRSPPAADEVQEDAFGRKMIPTIFNGQEVPPLLEYDGTDFEETIANGYW